MITLTLTLPQSGNKTPNKTLTGVVYILQLCIFIIFIFLQGDTWNLSPKDVLNLGTLFSAAIALQAAPIICNYFCAILLFFKTDFVYNEMYRTKTGKDVGFLRKIGGQFITLQTTDGWYINVPNRDIYFNGYDQCLKRDHNVTVSKDDSMNWFNT